MRDEQPRCLHPEKCEVGAFVQIFTKRSLRNNPQDYGAVRSLESNGSILRLAYLDECE